MERIAGREEEKEKGRRAEGIKKHKADVWKFINKRRGRKAVWMENKIKGEEWRKYFMGILNEQEGEEEGQRTVQETGQKKRLEEEGQGDEEKADGEED